jgi:hypothetical protein
VNSHRRSKKGDWLVAAHKMAQGARYIRMDPRLKLLLL